MGSKRNKIQALFEDKSPHCPPFLMIAQLSYPSHVRKAVVFFPFFFFDLPDWSVSPRTAPPESVRMGEQMKPRVWQPTLGCTFREAQGSYGFR